MKNSHNLTGLLAESLVWLLLLVKDCWKSCFIGKTPTLYVFFRHHLRQDKNTFNARVLANVSEFFHHLVLQDGGEAIIPPILPVAAAHIKARKSPLCFRRSKAFERVMSTSTNTQPSSRTLNSGVVGKGPANRLTIHCFLFLRDNGKAFK